MLKRRVRGLPTADIYLALCCHFITFMPCNLSPNRIFIHTHTHTHRHACCRPSLLLLLLLKLLNCNLYFVIIKAVLWMLNKLLPQLKWVETISGNVALNEREREKVKSFSGQIKNDERRLRMS